MQSAVSRNTGVCARKVKLKYSYFRIPKKMCSQFIPKLKNMWLTQEVMDPHQWPFHEWDQQVHYSTKYIHH